MTFDTYGHLFSEGHDGEEITAAELKLVGA
jgi:hypothetical protein